ncbi:MAG: murein transglycosylase A, partial [Desulfobacterales bacterium]|nr:murein transglycosylase A [Desulfobacterales bacterium]
RSLVYFNRVPKQRKYKYGNEIYTAEHMIRSLETMSRFLNDGPSTSALNRFIRDRYHVYASAANTDPQVLFTGYYEPTYTGSRSPDARFSYPLYSIPADLLEIDLGLFSEDYKGHKRLRARVDGNRVVPYYSREQINAIPDFANRSAPVLWLENRIDRFFLEVQGSGRIRTPDGEIVRVHYAGSNGNRYRSIGRYLIRQGEIAKKDMSMQAIRKWLKANPHRMDEVLHQNPSFVFFKTEKGGPYGSIGVALTPFRSIATDRKLFPNGALCFLRSAFPDRDGQQPPDQWKKASLFVMNQDTGGAIRGPGRADIFCGNDAYAEFAAGHMNCRGSLYFLVMKQ